MKKLLIAITSFALAAPLLLASPAMAQTAQQNKMTTCNKDAGDKKGDERKAFMKECLSNKPAKPATQQDKMKQCNADAAGKKGDERKAFMSSCLKKDKS
ncbi:PsiF family protein [Herbaspirillum robiniae]|uniref:Phosphate starvation-inducible protein PsiF n=1 Tax=Herbaspirillum robiniae TaxID=2014887 RepID=A0A246WVJ4_9BURK|nr:PsiF family protein [Herbaspirillum robiniae]NUU00361.1 phosphate starvation-inducible protein PsiF [Herbaspirillum robiniae]OWY31085.1 phosphate starvation-inducible protein PsiF [Herbaspirillum robiniae]